jgi:hypothetical protein
MTDWIKHTGGPQPVADDVWVYVADVLELPDEYYHCEAQDVDWPHARGYQILNQHLIDAARLEGIRLGLEAAAEITDHDWPDPNSAIRRLDPETIAKETAR